MCVCECVFINASAQTECDTGAIFKWGLTGLNLEFSFLQGGCLIKSKEPSLPYYLSIAGKE